MECGVRVRVGRRVRRALVTPSIILSATPSTVVTALHPSATSRWYTAGVLTKRRTRNRGLAKGLRLALIIVLLLALAGLIAALGSRYLEVAEVRVPEVVGADFAAAQRTLREVGLSAAPYNENVPGAAVDSVTSQNPAAGVVVRRGRSVNVGVHTPPSDTRVPSLVGLMQGEITSQLSDRGLQLGEVSYQYSTQPEGQIISQSPQAGELLGAGSGVDIAVSRGQEEREVALPDLVGLPLEEARRRLEGLGFRRVEEVPTRLGRAGVNAQNPRSGQRAQVSAPVTLYYSLPSGDVVRVPNVRGLPVERAEQALRSAGLRVVWVNEDPYDPAKPPGVVEINPSGHTLRGTPVALRVNGSAGAFRPDQSQPNNRPNPNNRSNQGAAQGGANNQNNQGANAQQGAQNGTQAQNSPQRGDGRTIPVNFDPAIYGSFLRGKPYEFRLDVTDAAGERTVISRSMPADEAINDSVEVYGEAELRMFIDGQIVLAFNP